MGVTWRLDTVGSSGNPSPLWKAIRGPLHSMQRNYFDRKGLRAVVMHVRGEMHAATVTN